MAESFEEWQVAPGAQPQRRDYSFDLDEALASVVALNAKVPAVKASARWAWSG